VLFPVRRNDQALDPIATSLPQILGCPYSRLIHLLIQQRHKFSPYFGKRCQSWCADFASWTLDQVGDRNKRLPWGNPSSVSSILAWARKSNQIVKQPAPGDLFIMKARGQSHVGFVKSVKGKVFYTVEGNTTKPGNKRIQGVFRKARDMQKFPYIFVRVPAKTQT
jgi:CHAP domain